MQLSDRLENLLAVGNIIVLLLHIPLTYCQHLPSKNEDKFKIPVNPEAIFLDNHVIPDGTSVSTYLRKGEHKNYFFPVEKNNLPLKIVLTPCSSRITWTIKRGELLPAIEDTDGDDDEMSDPDPDPFHAQRSVNKNPSSRYSILGNFSGSQATTYYHGRVRKGLYMIGIVAVNSDTGVKLYGTTTPYSDHAMPTLPKNKSVSITAHSSNMISFEWNKSSLDLGLNESLEYCVSVNRVKNYETHCSVMSQLMGDRPPKTSPWGFTWENRKRKRSRKLSRKAKRTALGKIFYKCIGSKTKYTFNKAKPGKTYFVNVFVLNRKVNIDAAYSGTNVKTDKRKGEDGVVGKVLLQDGKRQTIKLHKGSAEQLVVFKARRRLDSAVLELKSCRGKIPITIYHRNINIHQTVVRKLKVLRMKNLPKGQYTIKLTGNQNRKRVISILLTSSIYKKTKLPLDSRIKVYDNESTCNSVTLAWLTTTVKQRYCLYKRESSTIPSKRSYHCLEMSGRRQKDQVMCVRLKRKHSDKTAFKYTINNLKQNTDYVFDLYVNRGKGASLAYQSVIARTKASCTK